MSDYPTTTLKQSLRNLGSYPYMSPAVRHLTANNDTINAELSKIIVAEIPAYSESRNPDVLPDMVLHGPTATSSDEELVLIHVASGDQRVHPRHQVVVVLSGIVVVDEVAELRPVAGAASRVGVEDHVAR